MSRTAAIVYALLFAGSLVVRDVALGFLFNPVTTFVFAEIHSEKESSEKSGKEGAKEMDEFKIPFHQPQSSLLSFALSGIPSSYTPYYPSVIAEVKGRPPELA